MDLFEFLFQCTNSNGYFVLKKTSYKFWYFRFLIYKFQYVIMKCYTAKSIDTYLKVENSRHATRIFNLKYVFIVSPHQIRF